MGQDKEAEKHLFLNVLAGKRDSAPGTISLFSIVSFHRQGHAMALLCH